MYRVNPPGYNLVSQSPSFLKRPLHGYLSSQMLFFRLFTKNFSQERRGREEQKAKKNNRIVFRFKAFQSFHSVVSSRVGVFLTRKKTQHEQQMQGQKVVWIDRYKRHQRIEGGGLKGGYAPERDTCTCTEKRKKKRILLLMLFFLRSEGGN